MTRLPKVLLSLCALSAGALASVRGSTATGVFGLYYTGTDGNGGLLSGSSQDSHWSVTYASTNGGTSKNGTYVGNAYVVGSSYIDGGWTPNTSTAQWIVPPGAAGSAAGQSINAGGDYLPGNGNTGNHEGIYVYTLQFYIAGTGTVGSVITNSVSISLTLAADDQATVYVNPTEYGSGAVNTGASKQGGSLTSAWSNTSSLTLQNGTNGTNGNATFVLGNNTLVIEVDNTNSVNGSSTSNALNPSGLLVYQIGSATLIDGKPVPEVGAWLPAAAILGFFCWRRTRPQSKARSIA